MRCQCGGWMTFDDYTCTCSRCGLTVKRKYHEPVGGLANKFHDNWKRVEVIGK